MYVNSFSCNMTTKPSQCQICYPILYLFSLKKGKPISLVWGHMWMGVWSSLHVGTRISAFSQGLNLGLALLNIFTHVMDEGTG